MHKWQQWEMAGEAAWGVAPHREAVICLLPAAAPRVSPQKTSTVLETEVTRTEHLAGHAGVVAPTYPDHPPPLVRKATQWLSLKIPADPIGIQTNYSKASSKTVRSLKSENARGMMPSAMPEPERHRCGPGL